ncbi:MAG: YbjN domain-containing protein [Cyanobacteria bacterium P01_D01_bin.14]
MQLTFQLAPRKTLQVHSCEFRPIHQDGKPTTLYLIGQLNWQQYQQAQRQHLFNLKPETQGASRRGAFRAGESVAIELRLSPQCLAGLPPFLLAHLGQATLQTYWQQLVEQAPRAALIQTESWYLLAAAQMQETELVGYRTLWDFLDANALSKEGRISPRLFAGVNDFIRQSEMAQPILADYDCLTTENLLNQSADCFQSVIAALDKKNANPSAVLNEMVNQVANLAVKTMTYQTDDDYHTSLLRSVMAFLVKEKIDFEQNVAKSVLRFHHVGNHGEWDCYVKTQEDSRVFIFYSIPPLQVPQEKLTEMAQYICSANYGLVMGNLEMDFTDGEIRYKTSIDVEGDTLSFELIRNMVGANLSLMDRYLPGILAIVEQGKSAEAAMSLLEE